MHYTLVEFVRDTQAIQYVIGILFILSFIDFWRLLHKQDE